MYKMREDFWKELRRSNMGSKKEQPQKTLQET